MTNTRLLWKELTIEGMLFLLLAVAIVTLQDSSALVLLALLAITLFTLTLWHDRFDVWSFGIVATFGTCAEILFVYYGVWRYDNPTFLGIPLWFPVAFGTAALIGERFIRSTSQTSVGRKK